MALEMKLGDTMIITALLVFVVGSIGVIFVSFDNSQVVNGIGDDFNTSTNNVKNGYTNTESSLQTLLTTDTGFKVQENVYIDERGDAESSLMSESGKTTVKGFIDGIKDNKFLYFIHANIWTFVISIIILILSILGLRMVLGNGRI